MSSQSYTQRAKFPSARHMHSHGNCARQPHSCQAHADILGTRDDGAPTWGNLCAKVAAWRMSRRSKATDFRTSGRCTLMATSPPPYRCVNVARYTCARVHMTLQLIMSASVSLRTVVGCLIPKQDRAHNPVRGCASQPSGWCSPELHCMMRAKVHIAAIGVHARKALRVCTCPSEAAARGLGLMDANTSAVGRPRERSTVFKAYSNSTA